jgi:hypothetical protein
MKRILFLLLFIGSFMASAQTINNYKYALVPARFSIFKNDDYYRLNVMTKLYMQKYGFEAYLDNEEQPTEFSNDNCNKVYVDLIENNTMFVTKIQIIIKDCYGKVIATSDEGRSKEKDLQVAYNQSLRSAFDAFVVLVNHKYNETILPSSKPVESKFVNEETKERSASSSTNVVTELFAKPYLNGFQLLTNKTAIPNLVLTLFKTSNSDCYIAEQNNKKGILFKKIDGFYFEYYENGELISEKYTIVNF